MNSSSLWLFAPIVGLVTHALVHIILSHTFARMLAFHAFALAFLLGAVVVIGLDYTMAVSTAHPMRAWLANGLASDLTFIMLAYSYFHFFNLGETGRRMRTMIELLSTPNGLSEDELVKRYDATWIINKRLERLLSGGQVVEREGRLYTGKRMMFFIAVTLNLLKVLIFDRSTRMDPSKTQTKPTKRIS